MNLLSSSLTRLKTGGTTSASGVKGEVYFGKQIVTIPEGRAGKKKIEIDNTKSLADAIAMAYTWTDAQRKAFVAKARALGYDDTTDLSFAYEIRRLNVEYSYIYLTERIIYVSGVFGLIVFDIGGLKWVLIWAGLVSSVSTHFNHRIS